MYDIIKRQNGEAFARRIRDFNPSIFDIENLPQILKYAGRNPLPLIRFLSTLKVKEESNKADTLDPFELLNRAGYDAFYADTLEKQNSIRPFFKSGEELCTFIDSSRFKKYYIVHAVKRGADKLDREAFNDIEDRQDEYGTSVISIQILKQGGFIKITNRYNHTVDGCDNTFNSNPDNIILGLTRALADYFEVPIEIGNLDVPNGFLYQNGCLYGYLVEKIPTGVSLTNNSELRLVYAPNLYQTPDLNRLPSLERFDCAKGVYLREKPTFVASNRGLFNKFVFLESTQNENG